MSRLTLRLFGPPRLERDGAPIETAHRKALALLAYLAVMRQRPSREALAALFWPEAEPSRAYANLRHSLWELNQALGEGWVVADRDTVGLDPDTDLWLDVAQFRAALAKSQQVERDCGAGVPLLAEAAALYQDDFLAGFSLKDAAAFDEWAFFEAEGLRRDLAAALETLVRCQCEQGQAEAAIPFARRWLALDPLNEAVHRQLMQVYAQAGQHSAALRQYQECARILRDEVGDEPQPETTALYERLKTAGARRNETTPSIAIPRMRSNLPAQLTSFIGREQELAELKRLLITAVDGARQGSESRTTRLVTLTGPGGTGKTRLSLHVAADLLAAFPDGVWLVELAPLVDPVLVPQTAAVAVGLREELGRPILDTLLGHLRAKIALLLLDNCEHLVAACAQLGEMLLRQCPDVRILASSREALGVPGEIVYRVPSLAFPPPQSPVADVQSLLHYESTRLFGARASAALPGFTLTQDNAAAVAQICYRLDGIPLAIELAAARVALLRVEQIAARLDDRFRLLTGGSRTALPRHQTLRASIDWSYDLLPEPERVLLQRLSVFAGGWTLEAAEAVCGTLCLEGWAASHGHESPPPPSPHSDTSTLDVLDLLTQLVNKSLVIVEREQGEETRYRLLETIRQYVREKLLEAGAAEAEQVRDRHLDYFLSLAERAEPELIGPQQLGWLNRLEGELDNLRVALGWSLERDAEAGVRLASALGGFWEAHGYFRDGYKWLAQLLLRPAAVSRTAVRAKALMVQSGLIIWRDFGRGCSLAEESLALYREMGDRQGVARSISILGMGACLQDDYALARSRLAESLALYRALGDKLGIADVLSALGSFADNQDYLRARAYLEESLAIYRELGHLAGIGSTLSSLGMLALWQGDYTLARPWLEEESISNRGQPHWLVALLGMPHLLPWPSVPSLNWSLVSSVTFYAKEYVRLTGTWACAMLALP